MREPLYKKRPGEPNAAVLGGERINEFITMSEGFSNCYRIETAEDAIQINAGMGFEAPVHRLNFEAFSASGIEEEQIAKAAQIILNSINDSLS